VIGAAVVVIGAAVVVVTSSVVVVVVAIVVSALSSAVSLHEANSNMTSVSEATNGREYSRTMRTPRCCSAPSP
jgi:hypothetical protein